MKNFDINIIILTYRSDLIAKINFKIALEAIMYYNNTRLIVGYGGNDSEHYAWITSLSSQLIDKSSFELISEISGSKRMKWALEFPSEWLIFITDDDLISSNYIEAYIKEIAMVGDDVANIYPKYYGLNFDGNIEYREFNTIVDENPFNRAKLLINSSYTGVRFWSAHRAIGIKLIYDQNYDFNFSPSYLDQLMTLSTVLNGKSISCKLPNLLIYNIENWINEESSIRTDSKYYKNSKMVFFHEILWATDYINIICLYCAESFDYQWIKLYCLSRINDALNSFISRMNIIEISKLQVKSILDKINELASSVSNCNNIEKLRYDLNEFKKSILKSENNQVFFEENN